MSADTIETRVARGIALLDEKVPGWFEQINLGRLNLRSGCNCVLGQTWAGYYDPDAENPYIVHALALFGDNLGYESAEIGHGFNADDGEDFRPLTAEWKRVILARRGGAS